MLLDGRDLGTGGGQLRRLPARSGAEVEDPLAGTGSHRRTGELGAPALRPGIAALEPLDRDRLDHQRPVRRPDGRLGRLVLGAHEGPRGLGAELPPPGRRDPVRVGVQERRGGRRLLVQAAEEAGEALRQSPHDRVREGHRALEPGRAHELHGLVHGRVLRDGVHEGELVGAGAERRANRRVELPHRPAPERLDAVVERADALNRAVGELLREGAVARVEPLRGAPEGPVGVGAVLEDPLDDACRDRPRGADHGLMSP